MEDLGNGLMFDSEARVYRHGDRVLPGVHETIRRRLVGKTGHARNARVREYRDETTDGARGLAGGIKTHAQLERYYNHGELPVREHEYSRAIRGVLARMNLRGVRCEVGVYNLACGYATRIDGVAHDRAGRPVVLEFKTGSVGAFYDASGCWARGLRDKLLRAGVSSSACGRAMVQGVLGALAHAGITGRDVGAYRVIVLRAYQGSEGTQTTHNEIDLARPAVREAVNAIVRTLQTRNASGQAGTRPAKRTVHRTVHKQVSVPRRRRPRAM